LLLLCPFLKLGVGSSCWDGNVCTLAVSTWSAFTLLIWTQFSATTVLPPFSFIYLFNSSFFFNKKEKKLLGG